MCQTIKFFFIGYVFIGLWVSCSSEKKEESIQQTGRNDNLITINLDTIQESTILYSSSLFKSVTPIILETTDESLIGNIDKIEIYKDLIFVLDNIISKKVLVFDTTGKFIRKIGNRGQGPGEYTNPTDFTIDTDNEYIYVYDGNARKLNCYNIQDGNFIRSVKTGNDNIKIHYIQYYDGKLYTDATSYGDAEKEYMLQEIDIETGKQKAAWLENKKYNKGYSNYAGDNTFSYTRSPFYNNHSFEPKFVAYFMDTILSINKDEISPFLAINSKKFINEDKVKLIKERGAGISNELYSMDVIFNLRDFIELPNIILFDYQYNFSRKTVLFNKENNFSEVFNGIIDDLTFKINLKAHDFGISSNFVWSDTNGVYSVIPPTKVEKFIELTQENKLNLNEEQKEKLKALSEDFNPIIFYYEYEYE
jgi:hypothetical protein